MEIKSANTYQRNNVIYIDATLSEMGRIRFSTKLKATKQNLALATLKAKEFVWEYLGLGTKQKERKLSLHTLGEQFLQEECAHLKAQTLIKYRSNLQILSRYFGSKDVRLLTQEQLLSYADENKHNPYKIMFLNRILNYAKENDIALPIKPLKIRTAKNVSGSTKNILPLSLDEIYQVLNIAQGELKSYLYVGFFTGMRTGEILALEWSDIDFENNKIFVGKSKERATNQISTTKTHASRHIDLLPILKSYLLELKAKIEHSGNSVIFSTRAALLLRQWYKLLDSVGLQKRALYQTRHSFATLMLTNNEEPLWVSAMLGHKSLATTYEHYVKYIPSKRQRASFLDDVFNGTGGAK